jgi:hypothetical protein
MEAVVTYIYPTWGLIPTLDQMAKKFHAVHVRIAFADDSTLPVDVVHNLQLPYGVPLQPPEFVEPLVVVNPIAAGPAAPQHVLTIKDGNTISIGRAATGPGSVTYDVWIFRPRLEGHGWFE